MKSNGKKALAYFLSVLMVLTALPLLALPKAEAASSGSYKVKVWCVADNGWKNDKMWVELYLKNDNGTGASSYRYEGDGASSSGDIYYEADDDDWSDGHTIFTWEHVVPGFPSKVEYMVKPWWLTARASWNMYIAVWDYSTDSYVTVAQQYQTANDNDEEYFGDGKESPACSTDSANYPYPSTDNSLITGGSASYTAKANGLGAQTATLTATIKDQYGVVWGGSPTWSITGTANTGASVTTSASDTTTLTIPATSANSAKTTATVTASLTANGHTAAPTKSITITPTYKISFNGNSGTLSGTPSVGYATQTNTSTSNNVITYTVPDSYTATRTGYTIMGWSTNPNAAAPSSFQSTVSGLGYNATLYPIWKANTNTSYTVNYWHQKVGGGTAQNSTNFDKVYTTTPTDGTTAAGKTVTPIAYDGFLTPAAQTKTIAADGSTVFDFYYTRRSYTLTIDANGGNYGTASVTKQYGDTCEVGIPTRSGYTFDGWTVSAGLGTWSANADKSGTFTFGASGATLKAQWHENASTLTPVLGGGTYTGPSGYKAHGTVISLIPNPTRTGYTFGGWVLSSAVDGSSSTHNGTLSGNVSAGYTYTYGEADGATDYLIAQWTPNKYPVTWKNSAEAGGAVIKTEDWDYDSVPVYSGALPERTPDGTYHYVFSGWAPAGATVTTSGLTLTAVYNPVAHTPSDEIIDYSTVVASNCVDAGSYEVYKACTVCGTEIPGSRRTVATPADPDAHIAGEPQITVVNPTATSVGYVHVEVRCVECGEVVYKTYALGTAPAGADEDYAIPAIDNLVDLTAEVTTPATCAAPGVISVYVQAAVGAPQTYTFEIPVQTTVHPADKIVTDITTDPATCSAEGTVRTYCSLCNTVLFTGTLPKIPHANVTQTIEITKEPTCSATGLATVVTVCDDCGETVCTETGVELAKIAGNHSNADGTSALTVRKSDASVAATCAIDGEGVDVYEVYCPLCDTVVVANAYTQTLPRLQHADIVATEHRVEPTCTVAGSVYYTYACRDCGEVFATTDTVVLAPLGHEMGAWADSEDGSNHVRSCTREGCDYSETAAHSYDATVIQDATCSQPGVTRYTCDDCGYTYDDTGVIDPNNHAGYGAVALDDDPANVYWTHRNAPTCETNGYSGDFVCAACHQLIASGFSIPALGHDMGEWTDNLDGTHTAACKRDGCVFVKTEEHTWNFGYSDHYGHIVYTCTKCGCQKTEDYAGDEITVGYVINEGVDTCTAVTSWRSDRPFTTTLRALDGYHLDSETPVRVFIGERELPGEYFTAIFSDDLRMLQITVADGSLVMGDVIVEASAEAHVDNGHASVTEASCASEGFTQRECAVCGYVWRDTYTPAKGHNDADGDGKCDECGVYMSTGTNHDEGEYVCWCGEGHANNIIGWFQCFFTMLRRFIAGIAAR
ncbi:MAG: InlB B-repeat-containing protein [Clostridia bacterium]|nr:InlB B-repeat-containing protein [Clostridia bacterium]